MSAPHGDDLERRLTELFQQRAAGVTQARPVDLGSDRSGDTTVARPARFQTVRRNLGVLAATAAVLAVFASAVLALGRDHYQPGVNTGASAGVNMRPSVEPKSTCMVAAPASWRQAIDAGAYPVDRNLNGVVSVNGGTGDYLAVQGNVPADRTTQIYSDLEVALFRGSKGKAIYHPEPGDAFPETDGLIRWSILADPTGAVSAGWVTFAVAYPHQSDDPSSGEDRRHKVMLYQRGTGALRTLAGGPEQPNPERKRVRGAPVIAAGKVHWLAAVDDNPETTTLESWDLSRGSAAGSVPAPHATGLVPYGKGVAWTSTVSGSNSTLILRNGAGVPLTETQLAAARGGSGFGFDGVRTLWWLRHDGASVAYAGLVPGREGFIQGDMVRPASGVTFPEPVYPFTVAKALYPFAHARVNGKEGLLDLRSGTAVALPEGHILQAVVGDKAVFGTGTTFAGAASGSGGLSIVELKALPPVPCGA